MPQKCVCQFRDVNGFWYFFLFLVMEDKKKKEQEKETEKEEKDKKQKEKRNENNEKSNRGKNKPSMPAEGGDKAEDDIEVIEDILATKKFLNLTPNLTKVKGTNILLYVYCSVL